MMGMRLFMMLALKCLPHKYRRQHRKDEGLQEGHQHFNQINKYSEPDRERRSAPARSRIQLTEDEYEGNQTDNDNMPGHHIGKKTDNEGKGLDKHTQKLHRHQDEFNSQGHAGRIKNMLPVMAVGTEENHHKGN